MLWLLACTTPTMPTEAEPPTESEAPGHSEDSAPSSWSDPVVWLQDAPWNTGGMELTDVLTVEGVVVASSEWPSMGPR